MGSAALQYARAGWPVFPCRESDGAPYTNAKGEEKIPRCKSPYVGNGVKDATTDEAVITEWWRRWPNAQIGAAMGRNGLFALDFDPRVDQETGEVWTLESLKANLEAMLGCPVPVSLVAVTPSGGVHVYLKQPRDDAGEIRNRGVLPDHVDVRGRGGYVIAPPSNSLGGENAAAGRYRWLAGRQDIEPAEAPASLIEILRLSSKAAVIELLRGRGHGDDLFDRLWTKWPKSAAAQPAPGAQAQRPTIVPDANEAVRAYALKALDREIAELRGSVQGTRNNNLNASSYALGQLVGAGALDEAIARTMLEAVAREWPDFTKSQGTIENGLSAGIAVPRDLSEVRENAERRAENAQRRAASGGSFGSGWRDFAPPPDEAPAASAPHPAAAVPQATASFQSGRVERLSDQPVAVRGRLKAVAAKWLEKRIAGTVDALDTADSKADLVKKLAFTIGLRVGAGLVDETAAMLALDDKFGFVDGLDPNDVKASLQAGAQKPLDLGPMLIMMRCAGYPLTDLGNAERFRERYGRDFRYTTAKGWLKWDGRRWKVLDQEKDKAPAEVKAAVHDTIRAIQQEGWFVRDTGFQDEDNPYGMDELILVGKSNSTTQSALLRKWGRTSESSGKLGCIAGLAERWLTVLITDFDQNPMMLNCENGTLHFIRPDDRGSGRVELHPHNREDMLTKMAACAYDPDAKAPEFEKLVHWAQPKADRRRYLQQWAGYNMTGEMGAQIFHIWWGPTAANGKSTVGNQLREAVGDYGDITNVETFLDEGQKKRGDQATPDIVRLPGVRFLTSGEPPKGAKINEALINSVTGGDPMLARDNFRSFFRFSPSFKWTLWCNAKPEIPKGTEGIWRRVKVLLWESHLEPHERDETLPSRLRKEYAGTLAWMVRGLIDWMDNGFTEPDDVKAQSEAYRADSDPLASFLRMCTVEDPQSRVQSSHLYEVFCAWAKAAGEAEWRQKGFSQAMKDRGFDNKQSNGMQWLGLRLVKQVADFIDSEGKVVTMAADQPPPDRRQARDPFDPVDDDEVI